jgi:hypothetical protein
MKDVFSKFPSGIDDRLFFQDINLDQVSIMKNYQDNLNNGNYSKASDILNNSEVSFYGAWILNLLENRLGSIEDYAINLEKCEPLIDYSDLIPEDKNLHWIGDNDCIYFYPDYVDCFTNIKIGKDDTSVLSDEIYIETNDENINIDTDNIFYENEEPLIVQIDKNCLWIGDNDCI